MAPADPLSPSASAGAVRKLARRAADASDPEDGLRAIVALRRELERLENLHVDRAVALGHSWRRIADALGVSRQAAHRRHAHRRRKGAPSARLVVTGRARRAVDHARREAADLAGGAVCPEHLLLGVLRTGAGEAVAALTAAGVTLPAARERIAGLGREQAAGGANADGDRPGISAEAREVFEESLREAVRRGDDHLGEEHILLALLRGERGGAGRALSELGTSAGAVRDRLEALLGARPRSG